MIIPVEVQKPNKPQSARIVGKASDELTAEQVAKIVGVPEGCFIGGKVLSGKQDKRNKGKGRRWSLVASVVFVEHERGRVCPNCGQEIL